MRIAEVTVAAVEEQLLSALDERQRDELPRLLLCSGETSGVDPRVHSEERDTPAKVGIRCEEAPPRLHLHCTGHTPRGCRLQPVGTGSIDYENAALAGPEARWGAVQVAAAEMPPDVSADRGQLPGEAPRRRSPARPGGPG